MKAEHVLASSPKTDGPSPDGNAALPGTRWGIGPTDPFAVVALVALAALTFVPALYLDWTSRIHAIRWPRFFVTTLIVSVVASLLLVVFTWRRKRSLRAAASLTIVTVMVFFLWPLFSTLALVVDDLIAVPGLGDVVAVGMAMAFLMLTVRLGREPAFIAMVATALIGWVVFMAGGIALHHSAAPAPAPVSLGEQALDAGAHTVLFLVLDAYGRADVLDEFYGIDNADFLDALAKRGFEVAEDARSDYSHTYASVSSMLALGPVFEPGPIDDRDRSLVRQVLSGDNAMFSAFTAAGYQITVFQNAWSGSQCGEVVARCVRNGFLRSTVYRLGLLTMLRPILVDNVPDPFPTQSLELLQALPDVFTGSSDTPRMVFVHVNVPHAPLQLTRDCGLAVTDTGWNTFVQQLAPDIVESRSTALRAQMDCVNRLTLRALDALLAFDPEAMVVVTADHGPMPFVMDVTPAGVPPSNAIHGRFGILLATRMPAPCGAGARTPMNAARTLTDCAAGTLLGQGPTRMMFVPPEEFTGHSVEVELPG